MKFVVNDQKPSSLLVSLYHAS